MALDIMSTYRYHGLYANDVTIRGPPSIEGYRQVPGYMRSTLGCPGPCARPTIIKYREPLSTPMMPSPPERPCSERPMAKLASLCDWSNGTSVEELAHRILPSTDVSAGGFSAHRKWSVSGPRGSAHSQRGHVRLLRERSALTKGERELMNGFSSNSRSPSIEKSCKSTGSPTQSVSNDLRKSPAGDSSKDSDEYLGVVLMCQRMSARSRYEISAIQPVKYASDMGSGYMARCPRRLFQHIQGLRQMDDQSMRDEVYHYDSYLAGRPSPCSDLSMDSSRTGSRTDGSSSGGSRCTTSGHRRIEVHLPRLS